MAERTAGPSDSREKANQWADMERTGQKHGNQLAQGKLWPPSYLDGHHARCCHQITGVTASLMGHVGAAFHPHLVCHHPAHL